MLAKTPLLLVSIALLTAVPSGQTAWLGRAVLQPLAGRAPTLHAASALCPGSGSGTVVCVLPASQTVLNDQSVTITLSVSNASNVGAFQATVGFDPTILSFSSAASGSFLGSTGRPVLCQPTPSTGSLDVFCITFGPAPPSGVSGDGDLLSVTFSSISGGTSALVLSNVQLTDPAGAPEPSTTADGAVTVNAATATPCAGVCPTSTATPSPTATTLPSGTMILSLQPPSASGSVSQQVTVDVVATSASNLAAFNLDFRFDASIASVVNVTSGPFLGSTGRTVFCFAPTVKSGDVTFGCATQGTTSPGASGSGILAAITFTITGQGSTALTLSAQATDPQGDPLALLTQNGTLAGTGGPAATPTPCSGPCPTPSPAATSTPRPTPPSYPQTCASSSTVVCIQPITQSAAVGSNVDVGVIVGSVSNLGAFQFTVTVDPAVLTPLGASVGDFLGASGRTVLCAAATLSATSVQFSCGTLGAQPPAGPSGSGILAAVHFQVAGSGTTNVALGNTIITDPQGSTILSATQDGVLTAFAATATPCAGPCPTPTITPLPTATPTPPAISCPGSASATICLSPSTQTVNVGTSFTIAVVVDRASNIGSYQFQLTFDGVRLTADTAIDGGFLGSTGRTVLCPPPVITTGSISFACASVGTSPPGPTAPGVLATVTFTAQLAGSSTLHFAKATLSDPLANPIPVTPLDGSVTIQ